MKAPINSSGDDFGITFAGNKESGFFSSNRNDARGYDHLYSFELPVITIFIEGIVSDVDENPIEDATVRIVGRDGLNEKVLAKKDGKYRVELERDIRYVMMASARGYLNQNFELKTGPEEKNETYIVDFFLSSTLDPQSRLVEIIENIFDHDRFTDRGKEKVHDICFVLLLRPCFQLKILIQVSTCACHHHIADITFQFNPVLTVFLCQNFFVQTIPSDNTDRSIFYRVLVHIRHDTFDKDSDNRQFERIQMVISTRIIAIGTKKATFFISGKRDTEIIAGRVDRRLHILDIPLARAVQGCFENIQPTHSRMSIGSKIKRYGIPHIRKHLITRRINAATSGLASNVREPGP